MSRTARGIQRCVATRRGAARVRLLSGGLLAIALFAGQRPAGRAEGPQLNDVTAFARIYLTATPATNEVSGEVLPAFRFRRTGSLSEDLEVRYLVEGSGRNGVVHERLPGRIVIPAGMDRADVVVRPRPDGVVDGAHNVTVRVLSPSHSFSLIVLPDTQYYLFPKHGGAVEMFRTQIEWIARVKDSRQVEYVLHLGDITELNTMMEWSRARSLFKLLDGVVPYALAFGNHDGIYGALNQTQHGNSVFKTAEFAAWPTYGGVFEANRMENTFHKFSAGGVDWLILSLEYGPRDLVLEWANAVAAQHPERKIVVITHAHVFWDNTLLGSSTNHVGVPSIQNKRQNDPPAVWDKFLRRHANITLVLNGHSSAPGKTAGQVIGMGDHGNRVFQFLSDYQFDGNGGGGCLRIVTFNPRQDSFEVATYSPFFDRYQTNSNQQFAFTGTGIFAGKKVTYQLFSPATETATLAIPDPDVAPAPPLITGAVAYGDPPRAYLRFEQQVDAVWAADKTNYAFESGRQPVELGLSPGGMEISLLLQPPLGAGESDRLTVFRAGEPISSVLVTNHGALLMADFASTNLSGWKSEHDSLFVVPPLWRVADQKLFEFSGNFSPAFSANDNRRGPMLLWSAPEAKDWTDYSLAATVLPGQPHGIGLVFRYRDANNHYKLEVDASRRFHKLTRRMGGSETLLAQAASFGWETNNLDFVRPTRMRVELLGNRIEAFWGDHQMFAGPVYDDALSIGTVGVHGWANRGASFSRLVVARTGSVAPAIRFISPKDLETSLTDNALQIELEVEAGPAAVKELHILNGTQLLVVIREPPFNWRWTNIPAGLHRLAASITDQAGNQVHSAVRLISAPQPVPHPVFVRQPVSVVAEEGQAAAFYARAIPRGLSYQWFLNGIPVPSATNKLLILPAVGSGDLGVYELRASNERKEAISVAAHLSLEFPLEPRGDSPVSARLQLWDLDPDGWLVLNLASPHLGRWQIQRTDNFTEWELEEELGPFKGWRWLLRPYKPANGLEIFRATSPATF